MSSWQGSSYETDNRESSSQSLLRLAAQQPQGPEHSETSPAEPVTVAVPTNETAAPPAADGPVAPRTSAELARPTDMVTRPPATEGWRAALARWTGGLIKLSAGPEEMSRLQDTRDAGVQLSRPVTVMVANPRGGVGKTPTTVLLAAILGQSRGGGVVAWDNNENQGTLGLRTEPGRFPTTILDLLDHLEEFEGGRGRMGDLGRFMRHQQSGSFDALVSAENSEHMRAIGHEQFTRIHEVLRTFYQVIVVDTGNSLLAPNWIAAADAADVLVIPIRWSLDCVVPAGTMIDQLEAAGRGDLVRSAITVVSHAPHEYVDRENAAAWREWFAERTSGVWEIPYDPHIQRGTALRMDQLAEPTQRALLALGAEVSRNLSRVDSPTPLPKGRS